MQVQRFTKHHSRYSRSRALLLTLLLGLGLIQPAHAQTVTPGYVQAWGLDHVGQIDVPADLSDVIAVAASQVHSLALKSNGAVVAWGSNIDGQTDVPASAMSGVIAIAAGGDHSMALKNNGTVVAWGSNANNQLDIPPGLNNVIAIAAGDFHSMALKSNGEVVAWGCGGGYDYDQCTVPASALSGVTAIGAGAAHSLALKNGGVIAWGINLQGQTAVPASATSGVVAIAAAGGSNHSLAFKSNGAIVAWGRNVDGQTDVPAGLSGVVAIATGFNHSMALKSDGTLVAWGSDTYGQSTIPDGLTGIVGMAGGWHTLVIVPPPSVTINQAAGQADPATTTPILFTATFSKAVTDFTAADVTLSGTAGLANATVTISGGPSVYTLSVNGVTSSGTVIATIAANGATDANGYGNRASTSSDNSVTLNLNTSPPVITPNVVGTLGNNGWYVSNVTLSWTVAANGAAISSQSGCETQAITSDTSGVTFTCSATSVNGGSSSQSITIKRDTTAPTLSAAAMSNPNAAGWYKSDVTIRFTCSDALSSVTSCPADQVLSSEGSAVTSTAQTVTDQAGNQSAASNVVTVKIDKTAPAVTVNQAAGQSDPATSNPVRFDVLFSEPVTNFSASDVTVNGTANLASANITISGGPAAYAISVNGVTGNGTVIATIAANAATDVADNGNSASTSTDNSVTINIITLSSCTVNSDGSGDYTTIQDAVNNPSCTTITVAAGTYPEHVTIGRNVTISGAGASSTTVDGTQSGTVFTIQSGAVTLQQLTIAHGLVNGRGGGINNNGSLTVSNCIITGNTAAPTSTPTGTILGAGGGIDNSSSGTLTVNNCFIAGNQAPSGLGGGIFTQGRVTLNNSTIANNSAGFGGGIDNQGRVTVNNSTIAGNAASTGGGIYHQGITLVVNNSTIVGNSGVVGGVASSANGPTVASSIIAANGGRNCFSNFNAFVDGGGNLSSDATCAFTAATSRNNIDPKLDPNGLRDNRGPTPTIALLPGSPAIGAAVACPPPTTDQRGIIRPQGGSCDSGAYEFVDQTPPQITPNVVGTLGNNGWYTSDVNVTWSVVDDGSAISSQSGCEAQSITSDTNGVTFTCSATSDGGSSSQSVTLKRDATAPTITLVDRTAANSNGWNNGDVTVNWSCSDATAGVVAASASQTVSSEGADQTATGSCTDNAGNNASATQNGIKIDKTAPTISAAATTQPNTNGWYNSDVTVHFTCADGLSGVTSCPLDETLSSEGDAVSSTAQTITDLAGNSSAASNVVTVKIDKTAPTISAAATTQPNAGGWYKSDVTVRFTCADALAGLAPTACPADQVLSSEGAAVASTAQTVTDLAGNSSAASNVVTVQIDKTAPVVTLTGVSNTSYPLGSVPAAGCSTTDALSGVATQATLSITGGNPDGTGSFTATCSGATDNAGNSGSATVTYNVAYNWTGFFQPVDNLPTVNTVNAGQAIPVKFSLGGNYGLNIFATGYPASQQVSCGGNGGGSTSPIEETVTAGNSSLQYEPGTQRYIYVWKTDKAWAGTCRQLIVKLIDGTEHTAFFQFNGNGRSAGESDSEGSDAMVQRVFLPLVN